MKVESSMECSSKKVLHDDDFDERISGAESSLRSFSLMVCKHLLCNKYHPQTSHYLPFQSRLKASGGTIKRLRVSYRKPEKKTMCADCFPDFCLLPKKVPSYGETSTSFCLTLQLLVRTNSKLSAATGRIRATSTGQDLSCVKTSLHSRSAIDVKYVQGHCEDF